MQKDFIYRAFWYKNESRQLRNMMKRDQISFLRVRLSILKRREFTEVTLLHLQMLWLHLKKRSKRLIILNHHNYLRTVNQVMEQGPQKSLFTFMEMQKMSGFHTSSLWGSVWLSNVASSLSSILVMEYTKQKTQMQKQFWLTLILFYNFWSKSSDTVQKISSWWEDQWVLDHAVH